MPYSLVLTDIDGTLLNNKKELLRSTELSIRELVKSGILFATASVRTKAFTQASIRDIQELCCGNIYINGAIIETSDGEIIKEISLEEDETSSLIDQCNRLEASYCLISRDDAVARQFRKGVEKPFNSYHGSYREESLTAGPGFEVFCFAVVTEDTGPVVEFAEQQLPGLQASPSMLHPSTGLEEIFFLKKGVNKGSALKCLSDHFGLDILTTIAIGDDPWVDGPMIEAAGHGVAMKNAPPSFHERADSVTTKDNDEDGFGCFINSFFQLKLR